MDPLLEQLQRLIRTRGYSKSLLENELGLQPGGLGRIWQDGNPPLALLNQIAGHLGGFLEFREFAQVIPYEQQDQYQGEFHRIRRQFNESSESLRDREIFDPLFHASLNRYLEQNPDAGEGVYTLVFEDGETRRVAYVELEGVGYGVFGLEVSK
ncbi:hypothetical protein [Pontibacter sp. G13]|uniref:hypothetical protein n=1 Tax=Pontibacter sp. G13 TaxID=3074898 RepID=UPI00288A3907|nr:hypothetical protein [Pontibacter sp. G13]WNJ16714.1 hypothetical protein RJD25_17750 [Pontibacter sp. G13]